MMKKAYARLITAAMLLASVFTLAACGGAPPLHQPKELQSLPNAGYRMEVVWSADIGRGLGQSVTGLQPTVSNERVYVAGADGRVSALETATGKTTWSTETEKPLIAGPAVGNGILVVTTGDGGLQALAADTGEMLWHLSFSSEIIASPAIAEQTVVVRTLDGHVVAIDAETGNRKWTVQRSEPKLTMRGTSSPVIRGNTVYVGMDSGKVLALGLATGEKRWSQAVEMPTGQSQLARIVDVDADPVVRDNVIYAVSVGRQLIAMSRSGGNIRWRHETSSSQGMVVDSSSIYVVNSSSHVLALSRSGGANRWQNETLAYRKLSAPEVYRGGVLVGDYEGYLHWLSTDNGKELARGQPVGEAIRAAPIVVGNKALVLGSDGTLAAVKFVAAGGD
ncbi:outer membrane protein assembly factor BamB [Salinisphaera sp. USBA-960]|uniref:outer membrane protein assembly factor BamB n=1 Tax=Salinisphaera orenii TaxID=856731 RepID=UPI000DBE4DE3|nr:outer membrane protein assembly factor BamB [Salifodinibacter halophilus]NNC25777.1 outer membrane protein assembly factor BamB [Salifodinibacter halophilus]